VFVGLGPLGASMSGCSGEQPERHSQAANSRHKPLPGWTIHSTGCEWAAAHPAG
jgi:hypothetical protein